jgi:CheY-like chemotaxis protein
MEILMSKILIVEDDKFLRTVLAKRLKEEGFEIEEAVDGEDALQKIILSKPDLILLDIILPKKSGFTLLNEIKQDPNLSSIPIVVISQLSQPEDIAKGKEFGVKEYVVKANTSIEEIIGIVKQFLDKVIHTLT